MRSYYRPGPSQSLLAPCRIWRADESPRSCLDSIESHHLLVQWLQQYSAKKEKNINIHLLSLSSQAKHLHFSVAPRVVQQEVALQLSKRFQVLRGSDREFLQRILIAMRCLLQSILPVKSVAIFQELIQQ